MALVVSALDSGWIGLGFSPARVIVLCSWARPYNCKLWYCEANSPCHAIGKYCLFGIANFKFHLSLYYISTHSKINISE